VGSREGSEYQRERKPDRSSRLHGRSSPRAPVTVGRARLGAVVALAAVGVIVGVSDPGDVPAAVPRNAIAVDVRGGPAGPAIPPGFLGLSVEYSSLLSYSGPDTAAPNPTFIRLVRALAPGASPVIRFGGDTTDWTWWPTNGVPKPPGIRFVLTRRWLAVARATALAMGARLILGINLEADSSKLARSEARVLLKDLGGARVAGLELGNEPEVYGSIGWYTNAEGVSVLGRPSGYDFDSYLADYRAVSSALPRGVPLAGPASGAPLWKAGLSRFLLANPRVRIATFHAYPLRRCYTSSSSPTYPTIANLLSPAAVGGAATGLRAAVAVAHARGVQVRLDEVNSVSCKGTRGVSDVFASALWAVDTLFHLATAGVDGVNIHTLTGAPYAPFAFSHAGGHWRAQVRPMYYGLMLFTRAAPAGSRLLTTLHARAPGLRTWATLGPGGTLRIVLIDDSATRRMTLAVRAPRSATLATLERMSAPGLRARGGVTLAGQSYRSPSTTGQLSGAFRAAVLHPVQRRYVVDLRPASAALLTLKTR